MFKPLQLLVSALSLFGMTMFSLHALADDATIGYVKTVQGVTTVTSAGKTSNALPGTALRLGDTLNTGKNSSMGCPSAPIPSLRWMTTCTRPARAISN